MPVSVANIVTQVRQMLEPSCTMAQPRCENSIGAGAALRM
jgi:hypothetical protein